MSLEWTPGDSSGFNQWFWVYCTNKDNGKSTDNFQVEDNNSYTITDLDSDSEHECFVYGENVIGKGQHSSITEFTQRKYLSK